MPEPVKSRKVQNQSFHFLLPGTGGTDCFLQANRPYYNRFAYLGLSGQHVAAGFPCEHAFLVAFPLSGKQPSLRRRGFRRRSLSAFRTRSLSLPPSQIKGHCARSACSKLRASTHPQRFRHVSSGLRLQTFLTEADPARATASTTSSVIFSSSLLLRRSPLLFPSIPYRKFTFFAFSGSTSELARQANRNTTVHLEEKAQVQACARQLAETVEVKPLTKTLRKFAVPQPFFRAYRFQQRRIDIGG